MYQRFRKPANAPDNARLGAVTFVHRFGSALNGNIHFHCCVIDGLFRSEGEAVRFDEATLTAEVITTVQAQVRERVLRLFKRRGLLSSEVVDAMREWQQQGGFSLNADVTVPAWIRTLVSLLRSTGLCQRTTAVDREGSTPDLSPP